MKKWDDVWKNFDNMNWFGRRFKNEQRKAIEKVLNKISLESGAKIIDVGCGTGYTLFFFRSLGYRNSIGIDRSSNSIKICNKLFKFVENKDVFKKDIVKDKIGKFDLVFSDGLLEHYKPIRPLVKVMCSISKKWVLLFQPNQKSLFSKIKYKFGSKEWEKEYFYTKEDYIKEFETFGFKLQYDKNLNFNEEMILLFKKG
jgi:cyclopropane fatty-acyl-phospholipid synthase-like methyltransferase